jgi:hypothetical protein
MDASNQQQCSTSSLPDPVPVVSQPKTLQHLRLASLAESSRLKASTESIIDTLVLRAFESADMNVRIYK